MTVNIDAALGVILSMAALLTTVISVVAFVMKLRWDNTQQEKEIKKLQDDVNAIGTKITEQKILNSDEIRHMLVRIDAVDKSVVGMTIEIKYISDTVKELKDKLYKGA